MTGRTLSRRRFVLIGLGAATVTASGAVVLATRDDGEADPEPRSERPATGGPGGIGTVEAVGRRYLEEVPHEADRAVLLAALPAGSGAVGDEPGPALKRAVTADFADGRLVELDGWILSLTECRMAALWVV